MKNCLADQQNNCSCDQAAQADIFSHSDADIVIVTSLYPYQQGELFMLQHLHAFTACYLPCLMCVLTNLLSLCVSDLFCLDRSCQAHTHGIICLSTCIILSHLLYMSHTAGFRAVFFFFFTCRDQGINVNVNVKVNVLMWKVYL